MQSCKAHFLDRASSVGIEEIYLVDIYLVVYSIDKGRVDGVLEVSQRFKVGDLSESNQIVVEEVYPGSWPSFEATDPNSNSRGIDSSKVNGSHILLNS